MRAIRLPPWRTGRYGSAAFFAVLVTIAAAAVDPAVYEPALTPKLYVLLLASASVGLIGAVLAVVRRRGAIRITAIELLLVASVCWGFMANPRWLAGAGSTWAWCAVAALALTFITRQLFGNDAGQPDGGRTRRAVATTDLLCALCVCGSVVALHGLAEAVAAGSLRPADGSKTSLLSTLGHPNGFGSFVAAGIVGAVFAAAHARTRLGRYAAAAAALLQLLALLGNASRGALLGVIGAAMLTAWLYRSFGGRRREADEVAPALRLRRTALRPALSGMVVLLALVVAGLLLNRLNPDSGRGRLHAWEISAAMLADHPFTGVGTGRFGAEYGRYQAELWRDPYFARWDRQAASRDHPNNEYIHVLAEQGIPGGLLYLLLWVLALWYLLRPIARGEGGAGLNAGLLALLAVALVHAGVDRTLHWVPTLVPVHLALGLVPAPAVLRLDLGRRLVPRLLLALAAVWTGAVAVKCGREYPGYRHWLQAERAEGADRVRLLARAHRRLPPDPRIDLRFGTVLLEAGDAEAAVAVLQRALDQLESFSARLTLARAQLELGRLGPAEQHARTAHSRYPDRLGPQLLLARIHHAAGEEAQARAALARCTRRETWYRSEAVAALVNEATALWRDWYDDEPPA